MKKFLVSLIFLLSACGGLASLDEAVVPPAPSQAPSQAPGPENTSPAPLPVAEDGEAPSIIDASSPEDAGADARPAQLPPCGPNIMVACRGTSQGVPYCRMVSGPQDAGPLCSTPNESSSDVTCEETFSYCQWRSGGSCYLITNLTEAECAVRGGHL